MNSPLPVLPHAIPESLGVLNQGINNIIVNKIIAVSCVIAAETHGESPHGSCPDDN